MSGKKLLNSVERCVDENLEGLVTINPGLRLIKDTRVIVRADIEIVKEAGKVTVLCGGGSGHEPAHAGYVGCGMLSCAVAGSVFTSPPPQDILTGLRMIAKDNPAGALIIIMNYSGDRISFGLALEQAKTEGMSCDMVVVGEDCALKSQDKTAGRRGLCGTVFIHKIAGALAEEGKSLDEVTKLTQQAADSMGTIGLALGACSTPGSSGLLFTVQPDEMELGLGLHGEAGVKRIKLMSAKETVKVMIDHMTNPENSTHLAVKKGDRVACMINNLGGMSVLEMNVVAKETIQYLERDLGLRVNRAYCATYVTSLEMAGISISLLHLNDTFIRCLDAPTSAPGWQVPLFGPCQTDRHTPGLMLPVGGPSSETQQTRGSSVSKERCVDENLEGLVTINPGLRLIKDTRVIVRADIEAVKNAGKVTVLCGGGSGNEPAHAGYVGCGMLSCAVAGSVFTSPPSQDILTGLRMIAKDNPAGALIIIMNYSGDRINFGLALERAKTEGMSCDMVVVGEDCALKSHDKTAGRQGLCGTVFIHKIAGALAEEGKSLDEVTKLTQQAADSMGTIGLALGACSTPGSSGPLFTVQPDEMELGLGLHGEAGVKRIKLMSAKETVKVMIDHMTNPENSTHLAVKKGDRVACMINNLGGMSVLEMNVVAKETIQYLEGDLGLRVNRAYCATYVASLEMAGISISLLHLNDTFIRCLDAPTSAPGWQVPLLGPCQTDRHTPGLMLPVGGPSSETQQTRGSSVSKVLSKRYKTMSGKKLLNSVERCVDENLEGLVTINPGLRLIKDTRVIVRADIEIVKEAGKVTVLCGGGSGNEPAHAGYVGCGMLSCAVAGSVFTSPPSQDILTGLRMIAKDNPAGALIIIMNYSGDRINFGLALEQAKTEGMSCDMVVVGEDCALKSHDKTAGRQGLCGTVFIHKIAGALAEEGKSLDEVTKLTQQAADSMGTIGLALGACSTPGSSGPLFTVQPDEIELGLGLHGEAGVKRIKLMSAKETVKVMIDHMTNPENSTHLAVKKGDRVACMINNLGGMSVLEMNVVAKETIQYLEGDLGLRVNRAYCATYVTSLEMAGISISLLHLNDTFIRCLDAPTSAPGWHVPLFGPCQTDRRTPGLMLPVGGPSSETQQTRGSSVSKDEGDKIYDIIEKVCERLQSAKEQLDSLDSESGDGDCGSTMASGAQCVREKLGKKESPGLPVTNPSQLSLEIANIVETVMGGSSGGIYSLFFTAAATALQKEVTAQSWLQAMTSGMAAVQRYGGAEPGDRTMLDALYAAKETFEKKLTDSSPVEAFREAVKAAETAAENTKNMSARAGRASYVSADLLKKPDPGAMAVAVWLKAILELLN